MRNSSFLDFVDSTSGDPGYPSNLPPRLPEMLVNIAHSRKFAIAVNLLGLDFKNDDAAIAKAKVIAIGVSIDKPAVDPKRHIAVLNGLWQEIFRVSVYSKPSISNTQ
jgi:hypothetical protein